MNIVLFLLGLLVALGSSYVAYNHQTIVPIVTAVLAIVLFLLLLFSAYGVDRGRTIV